MFNHNNGKEKRNRQAEPHPCGSKGLEQLISMDECAKHIIDSALMKIQKQLIEKSKQSGLCNSNDPSLDYKLQDSNFERTEATTGFTIPNFIPSKRGGGWQQPQYQESRKEDISSILTSTIQKVMREAVSNVDNNSHNMSRGHRQAPPLESKLQRIKAASKPASGPLDMYGNMDHPMNMLDIDQLVKSMTKLCLLESGGNGSNLGSGDTSHKQYNGSSQHLGGPRRASVVRSNMRQGGTNAVIVTNQNGESASLNKELQAILQWMVASHFNVPNLTFLNDREGELADLPQLAQKATKKGYSVGEILQKVMRYLERTQMEEAVGKRPQCGLIRWLHANL
ncbi:A-kinase anchor protein 4-like [Python bivittatus]|uniref:A-kinase anchor protein 4-like n=1 Tax=Python bivittatus TaxID=176946 RepID=A0A9F5MWW1_PYTBI|nr:A-kinase anchor protein 4-like [Python bivittatus]